MVNKKTVYDCINVLMFNGKTISNTEFFKGKANADKMWQEAISVVAKNLVRWAEEKAISDSMFKEVTEDCKNMTGAAQRFITTSLYEEALEITRQRLEEENKPKIDFDAPPEPSHGKQISQEVNAKQIIPWWRRTHLSRPGTFVESMPTDEQIKWLGDKLNVDWNKGDNYIVLKCFLSDYKYAKEHGKTLLTKISVVNGQPTLSYAGE